jgi:hypothetical protein
MFAGENIPSKCADIFRQQVCFSHQCEQPTFGNAHVVVTSMLASPLRRRIIASNWKSIPNIEVFPSINGYHSNETLSAIAKAGVQYHQLQFTNYGTLATWLTKRAALQKQVCCEYEYMALLEDDVILNSNFQEFIENTISLNEKGRQAYVPGVVGFLCPLPQQPKGCFFRRFLRWGEAYLISLAGARAMLHSLDEKGITQNIDNEFDGNGIGTFFFSENKAVVDLLVPPGHGDIMKTHDFSESELKSFLTTTANQTQLHMPQICELWGINPKPQ